MRPLLKINHDRDDRIILRADLGIVDALGVHGPKPENRDLPRFSLYGGSPRPGHDGLGKGLERAGADVTREHDAAALRMNTLRPRPIERLGHSHGGLLGFALAHGARVRGVKLEVSTAEAGPAPAGFCGPELSRRDRLQEPGERPCVVGREGPNPNAVHLQRAVRHGLHARRLRVPRDSLRLAGQE